MGALAGGETSRESVDLAAPSTEGTYYYGACVDAVANEPDRTNNCSSSVRVKVSRPGPDLTVGHTTTRWDTAWLVVGNKGKEASAATTLRYFRTHVETNSRVEVGSYAVPAFEPLESMRKSKWLGTPSKPGTWRFEACVDPVPGETDTTNNCDDLHTTLV